METTKHQKVKMQGVESRLFWLLVLTFIFGAESLIGQSQKMVFEHSDLLTISKINLLNEVDFRFTESDESHTYFWSSGYYLKKADTLILFHKGLKTVTPYMVSLKDCVGNAEEDTIANHMIRFEVLDHESQKVLTDYDLFYLNEGEIVGGTNPTHNGITTLPYKSIEIYDEIAFRVLGYWTYRMKVNKIELKNRCFRVYLTRSKSYVNENDYLQKFLIRGPKDQIDSLIDLNDGRLFLRIKKD